MTDTLVRFFNSTDGYDAFGRHGDYMHWPPERTAIEAMRECIKLRATIAERDRQLAEASADRRRHFIAAAVSAERVAVLEAALRKLEHKAIVLQGEEYHCVLCGNAWMRRNYPEHAPSCALAAPAAPREEGT